MEDHQRQCLIREFEEFVSYISTDFGPDGNLDPTSATWAHRFGRAIEWLRGARGPSSELREFFEERLRIYDREYAYDEIVRERGALVAALVQLR